MSQILIVAELDARSNTMIGRLLLIAKFEGLAANKVSLHDFTPSLVEGHNIVVFVPVTEPGVSLVIRKNNELNSRSPPLQATRIMLVNQETAKMVKHDSFDSFGTNIIVGLEKNSAGERRMHRLLDQKLPED